MITDHRYDAGWPREDGQGCVADWPSVAPGGVSDPCGKPEAEHAYSEYPSQRPARDEGAGHRPQVPHARANERNPGDVHEPPPYRKSALDFWPIGNDSDNE